MDVKPGKPVLNCFFGDARLFIVRFALDAFGISATNGGFSSSCSATNLSDVDAFVRCRTVPMMKNRVFDMRKARTSNNLVLFLMGALDFVDLLETLINTMLCS